METRTAGASELRLTRIGLGLAALGRPGYVNLGHAADLDHNYNVAAMRDHAASVLDAGWNAGIRYFDAARSYGRAEAFLAHWLTTRSIQPGQLTIGSKWGYSYTANWHTEADIHEVKDHTLPTLQRQIGESSATLGDWIDLYQIHSATMDSGVLERDDVLDALAALRAERGWAIGLSLSGASSRETLKHALAIERDGRLLFSAVQATWNVLEPSLSGILADAHRAGLAVIAKETLANGRLTSRNNNPAFVSTRALLEEHAERLGCTIDQLALATVLDNAWIDCVLSGAATLEQLESNVGALSVLLDDDARDMLAALTESPATYWSTRSELAWN